MTATPEDQSPVRYSHRGVSWIWYPAHRVLHLWFTTTSITAEDGVAYHAAAEAIGDADKPYVWMVDAGGLKQADTGIRKIDADLHRGDARIFYIVYNLSSILRMVARMYFLASGVRHKIFATSDEAIAFVGKDGWRPLPRE